MGQVGYDGGENEPGGPIMPTMMERFGLDSLPQSDRLALLDELWDSLPDEVSANDIPAWHREEVDRRRDELDANPGAGRPWREVLVELKDGE